MGTTVTLSMSDLQRLHVVQALESGRITVTEAAEWLGRSVRQVRRIVKRYREEQEAGIPHRGRGRPAANALPAAVREQVVHLARERYAAYNNHHLRDQLAEEEGVILSVASVRRLRRGAGLASPRKRRPPKHRSRRPRCPQPGMMLQIDGSPFAWLGDAAPPFTLLAAIDDAHNEVFALFREEEDTVGYLQLLRQVIDTHGVPLRLYSDRHTIFQLPPNTPPSLEEQLAGRPPRTQFGRAVEDLGIRQILAHSPQAKGRVEKLFQTLQGRLAAELQHAQITTINDANAFLPGFLARFNCRFQHAPADPQPAYRPAPPADQLDRLLALHYRRVVAKDHTVSFGGVTLDVPHPPRRNYARKTLTVQIDPEGQISFWHDHTCLGLGPRLDGQLRTRPAQLMASLRASPPGPSPAPAPDPPPPPTPRAIVKPADGHPWRRYRQPRPKMLQSPPPTRG